MKRSTCLIRGLVGCLLGANLLLNSGCFLFAVAAVSAGSVAFIDGKLEVSMSNSYAAVVAASNQAISQLQFALPEESKDALTDSLVTRNAKGDRVEIVVTKVNDNLTSVTIRIGTFGNQAMSQTILDKIKSNL
jgi:hypothetical protein